MVVHDQTVHDHAPEVIYPGYIISNLHPFSSKSEIPWELQLKYCEIDGSGLSCNVKLTIYHSAKLKNLTSN
ncbi:unnamed protein product [Rhizophagus irregularis]|uniref:Uncharacterized protein n=1 Tax=Rhizophagus irregularis TaxID=588596 RepID=A0A915Z0R5_9GLOM|nr:unnamed protein product [Rhizophagus irregularis]